MTKEELAAQIDGNEYGQEISPELEAEAKKHRLVVVFGMSDDLMEFCGAIDDEVGAYDGGKAYVTPDGLFDEQECDEQCKYFRAERDKAVAVEAFWSKAPYSWRITTEIPHATFDTIEDGEKFCKGIVFSLDDVAPLIAAKG